MAEKEERLCLFTSVDYTISDTKYGVSFEGKIAPHKANIFTRQEAIEKIDYVLQDFGIRKNDLEIAEAALNALLGE